MESNMYSVLTDCPHREKLGWLDQDHLAIDPMLFSYDLRGYGRHMMKQMVDAQKERGQIPTTAPQLAEFGYYAPYDFDYAANWGVAIVRFAWKHYRTYNDLEILSENYEHMQAYIEHLRGLNETLLIWEDLGDWAEIDQTTPFGLTGTHAFALGARELAEVATVLGRGDEAETYRSLFSDISTAFQNAFSNTTGSSATYAAGSQCADAAALNLGAVPEDQVDAVYDYLIDTIRTNGSHLSVGEVCLEPFFDMLSSAGHNHILYDIMIQTTFPSYGYMVAQNGTALWEHWDGSGSRNHFMLGHGDTWLYGLAGMRQAAASMGWRIIDFKPVVVGDVKYAKAEFQSVRGRAAAEWTLNAQQLEYRMEVAVGSTGRVALPSVAANVKLDDDILSAELTGVWDVSEEDGKAGLKTLVVVGSGSYVFRVEM